MPITRNGKLKVKPKILKTRLHISKLPTICTKQELIAYFERFGPVHSARIKKDKNKKSKGHGKVTFKSEEGYKKSLEAKNDHYIQGINIRIEPFLSGTTLQTKEEKESQTKIIVFNIKPWMGKEFLQKVFGIFGKVTEVEIKMRKVRARHAILAFESCKAAEEASINRIFEYEENKFSVSLYDANVSKLKSLKGANKTKRRPDETRSINHQSRFFGDELSIDFSRKKSCAFVEKIVKISRERDEKKKSTIKLSSGRELEIFKGVHYVEGNIRLNERRYISNNLRFHPPSKFFQ